MASRYDIETSNRISKLMKIRRNKKTKPGQDCVFTGGLEEGVSEPARGRKEGELARRQLGEGSR